ncbi:hypothetical protein VKT23_018045 [Stygiomarasmius scandens]|uniref:C3H1-type domain-containing protein n=1 Tax=Marasmiellus scandens TaxID=2682957 RepID=A0ABR1IUF4_9AGAR
MSNPAVTQRLRKRKVLAQKRHEAREKLKNQGNDFFAKKQYSQAEKCYQEAIRLYGQNSVILSNLAQTYLKLDQFEKAEDAATSALFYDPSSVKSRYRRGLARKGRNRFVGAAIDFESAQTQDPNLSDIQRQLKEVRDSLSKNLGSASDGEFDDEVYGYPPSWIPVYHQSDWESDSDTSDCEHVGNAEPCADYNHLECGKGKSCSFSHAPDDWSVRDRIGRNVCILFLVNSCVDGSKCAYSHNGGYLPAEGWWRDGDVVDSLEGEVQSCFRIKYPREEILFVIHEILYENGYQPPRDLGLLLQKTPKGYKLPPKEIKPVSDRTVPRERFVLAISLDSGGAFDYVCGRLVQTLKNKMPLFFAKSSAEAIDLLSSPHIIGVLAIDPAIAQRKHGVLARKLVDYSNAGGVVVFGGVFPNIAPSELNAFWTHVWEKTWRMGDYSRCIFTKVAQNDIVKLNPSLPSQCSVKAVMLKNCDPADVVYRDLASSSNMAPVLHAKVGQGSVGFIGDVNDEAPSAELVLAMFGLLDHPYPQSAVGPLHKSIDLVPSQPIAETVRPFVLVLSLEHESFFDELSKSLYDAIREKASLVQVKSLQEGLDHLDKEGLLAVYIDTSGIARVQHTDLLFKVIDYTRAAGVTVIGGSFSSFISKPDMDRFWQKWNLPWKMGSYHRDTFYAIETHELVGANPSLEASYSMKAVHLAGPATKDVVYHDNVSVSSECPVVHTKLGNGYLGYVGDVNHEEGSTKVVLALLGLLDHRYERSSGDQQTAPSNSGGKGKKNKKKKKAKANGAVTLTIPTLPGVRRKTKSSLTIASSVILFYLEHHPEFDALLSSLLSAFGPEILLHRISNLSEAQSELSSHLGYPGLKAILVTEPSVTTPRNSAILNQLVDWTKSGGRLIFCQRFASLANVLTLDRLWNKMFGLSWKMGSFERSDYVLKDEGNLAVKALKANELLDVKSTVCMEAVSLKNVRPEEMVYSPVGKSTEAPVLFAQVEQGYVGYVGNVDDGESLGDVILAMMEVS